MFQSLFSWNLLLMARHSEYDQMGRHVSILVFVELALDDIFVDSRGSELYVSILVFVELALDVGTLKRSCSSGTPVSILVFVELALDDMLNWRVCPNLI